MHREDIELITLGRELVQKKGILPELFSDASNRCFEARNRSNALKITKNKLKNSFQLLLSSEIGPFKDEHPEFQRNSLMLNNGEFPLFFIFS